MDKSEGSSPSLILSASIVSKFKKEFEKNGMFKFTPELQGKLKKFIDESLEENEFVISTSCSLPPPVQDDTSDSLLLQPSEKAILPPLVYQFEIPKNGDVSIGMLINGKPEMLSNDEGFEKTPAFAGFTDDTGFVYGTEAKNLLRDVRKSSSASPKPKVWQFINFKQPYSANLQKFQEVELKQLGHFKLPAIFFHAFLIRKLKLSAEAQVQGNNDGFCEAAIMAVPMITKCAQRLRLKEAAILAGFQDVYVISAEGLAAYYWFSQKTGEIEKNNYSTDFVIVDQFESKVVYKKSFEMGASGKELLVVKAIILLDMFTEAAKEKDKFCQMIERKLKIDGKTIIPVISGDENSSMAMYLGSTFENQIGVVRDAELNYFAAKGAALLSKSPENLGSQVQNMLGSTIYFVGFQKLILPDEILPETFLREITAMRNCDTKYKVNQDGIDGCKETMGYLSLYGLKMKPYRDIQFEVNFELNWEGIWTVVDVSAKNLSDKEYKPVEWGWATGEKLDLATFGLNAFENFNFKSLLKKVAPEPSQSSQSQDEVTSTSLNEEDFSGDMWNNLEEGGIACSSSGDQSGLEKSNMPSTSSGVSRSNAVKTTTNVKKKTPPLTNQTKGMSGRQQLKVNSTSGSSGNSEERKQSKGRVIGPNDIIVNTGLKKIRLESDWVEPKAEVKTEEDSVKGFGNGQQGN